MKTKHFVATAIALVTIFFGQLAAQSASPMDDSLANLDKLISSLKVNSIIGEPIRAGNSIIIPFSRIKFGVGAGGSMMAFGGGMGGKAIPAGFLIIEGDDVRIELLPLEEKKPSFLEQMLPILLKALPQILGNKFPSFPGAPPAPPEPKAEKTGEPAKDITLNQMEKLFNEGKYSEALAGVDSLLAKDPNNADLHAWKGGIMGSMTTGGNPLDMMKYGMGAMQEFETALKLDPNNIRGHFGRGMGRLKAPEGFGRDYDGAIEDFSFVCGKKPSPEAFYQLGTAYRGKGIMDKAKEAFKKALALKPDYAEATQALAEIQ
jgi:uncharacterized spore protein YtfJ